MRGSFWINDWDAWTGARFVLEQPEGEENAPSVVERTTLLPQRHGSIPLAREAETAPRQITLAGTVMGTSVTDCRNKMDELKARLYNGAIEVRFRPRSDRMVLARCADFTLVGSAPKFANPRQRVLIRLHCPDPLIYTKAGTIVSLGLFKAPCPLGSGVSFPVIRIAGPVNNPVIIYRDCRGIEKQRLGFTVNLLATEYLEIDTERFDILRYTAGVAASGMALWTSGEGLSGLDPQDSDPANSTWPTLEVTPDAAAEAHYRKAWL